MIAKRTEFGQFPGRDTVKPQAGVDCAAALYKKAADILTGQAK